MRSPALAAFVFALIGAPLVSCSGSTIGGAPEDDAPAASSDDAGSDGTNASTGSTSNPGTDDASGGGQASGGGGSATDDGSSTGNGSGSNAGGGASTTGGEPSAGSGSTAGAGSSSGGATAGTGGQAASASYLPSRIRRLTNAELKGTIRTVFGVDVDLANGFVPDTRQDGFSRNAAQIVDPLFARQLQDIAEQVASQFVPTLASEYPCVNSAADEACANTILSELLPAAFRRNVEASEIDALVQGVFRDVASAEGFEAGMQLTITAALQSASFIYHTELGTANTPSEASKLTAAETASAMAYLLTGMPPDGELAQAAESGALETADGRATQASRLLGLPAARPHLATFIKEWLGIDAVVDVGKDKARFPDYENLRPHMLSETDAFVQRVVFDEGGSLTTLLSADFTVIGPEMAGFYGVSAPSGSQPDRVSLADANRRGILNHASFLARYATEVDSAPVHRGVAVGERVMCMNPGDPNALNVDIVPPQPDPSQTTRERFAQHTIDPECAGCHLGIDGVGFTFENFDAIGKLRTQDNNKPVDTATSLPESWAAGLDQDQFTDSSDLVAALGRSESVKRCFVRHASRFAGTATNRDTENYFISQWEQLEAADRDSIVEIMVAWVSSDVFVERAAQGGTQ